MLLKLAAHPFPFELGHESVGQASLPVLKEEPAGCRYFLLKDTCEALGVKYSKIRSKIHRGKADILKLVLAGQELQDFKNVASYETRASHIALVAESGFQELLAREGVQLQYLRIDARQEVNIAASSSPSIRVGSLETCPSNLGSEARSDPVQAERLLDGSRLEDTAHLVANTISNGSDTSHNLISEGGRNLDVEVLSGLGFDTMIIPPPPPDVSVEDDRYETPAPASSPEYIAELQRVRGDEDFGDVDHGEDHDKDGLGISRLNISRRLPDVDETDLRNGIKSVIKFKCYTLQDFDMTNLNHAEFHGLREFFSTPRGLLRGTGRVRNAQTIAKSRERICGYLGWLKQSGRVKYPSFKDFNDLNLFLDKYIDGYLVGIRELAHGSVANAITAAIDVHKYLEHLESRLSNGRPSKSLNIARLQRRRNNEQTLAERERQGSVAEEGTTILWEQFLEAVRQQKNAVDSLWRADKHSPALTKEVQKYLALAFYAAIPPSRSKEIRLLADRILSETESRTSLKNHIALIHGRHAIVVSDYKNRLYHGSHDAMELPSDPDMILKYLFYFLKSDVRNGVTKGKTHGFLFCKRNGDAFENAGEWSTYLGNIVEKHIGISNVSSNALRHSFTTFMETVADDDHVRLRESTAFAMRHNIRIQQHTYNNTPTIQRKRKAVDFASGVFKRVVLGDTPDTPTTDADKPSPSMGALVGTKLPDSKVGFGKIIRIEKHDALVMLLKVRDNGAMHSHEYVADIGYLLRRSIANELVWPIDGNYNKENGFYEIWTSPDEVGRMLVR